MKLFLKKHDLPGKLITFCGMDGSGKTTLLTTLLKEFIRRDIQPILTKEPTEAVRTSAIFRNFMDSSAHQDYSYRSLSLLAASDRLQHNDCFIYPHLKEAKTIISDRYFYSCLANLRARGFVKDQWIYEIAGMILEPSVCFFIDAPVNIAVKRVRQRKEEKERYIDMELQFRL